MENVSLKIELGPLSVDYSGPVNFLEDGLAKFCKEILELDVPAGAPFEDGDNAKPAVDVTSNRLLSTSDIAAKLGSKSGSDLVMCAAASLTFSQNRETFKRAELLAEMKLAKAFYKQTYSNNLSKSLDTLIRSNRLSSSGHETYVLPHQERESLTAQLGV